LLLYHSVLNGVLAIQGYIIISVSKESDTNRWTEFFCIHNPTVV